MSGNLLRTADSSSFIEDVADTFSSKDDLHQDFENAVKIIFNELQKRKQGGNKKTRMQSDNKNCVECDL